MRIEPRAYREIPLRAHSLLADVPIHDVWGLDLPSRPNAPTLLALRERLSLEAVARSNGLVRVLFALRRLLGRAFAWDAEPAGAFESRHLERLSAEERAASRIEPGTPDGPFRALWASEREIISEVRNATVHAFSVFALVPNGESQRFVWAIYVAPVGRITGWYMRLIDPFRHHVVYPAILREVERAWRRD